MRRTPLAFLVAIALALAGCGNDGRDIRAPQPGAVAPPLATTSVPGQGGTANTAGAAGTVAPASTLVLASTAIPVDGAVPVEFTCDGTNRSPPLSWSAVPQGTVELAIVVKDPDANGFVHWVLTNVDPSVQALAAGAVPEGAVEAKNDGGKPGWTGPCPPKGPAHHYVFTLYALTGKSGVTATMAARQASAVVANTPGITASFTATYQRA